MSPDGASIVGNTTQGGGTLPLNLERATEATAWEIPKPTAASQPMLASAHPSFEVATIKPSKPNQQGKGFTIRGNHFVTINTSLADIISFPYGVSPKQVVGLPDWAPTERFDIDGKPDQVGLPSVKQSQEMLTKLLADRFQLKMHNDKRELPAYVLTVAKGGPKLEKSDAGPDAIPGLFLSGIGDLHVHDATMREFTDLMQSTVFEKPVGDQTGLPGRYIFNLKWQADESQFGGMGVKVAPQTDAADSPPPLFTAIQEQVGLKLDAEKTAVPVLVIDHVEKPSEN